MAIARILLAAALTLGVTACNRNQTPATPPQTAISMDTARQTALTRVPGEIQEEELEEEDGRWVYEFDIKTAAGGTDAVQEVVVDANSGAIVKVEPDSN